MKYLIMLVLIFSMSGCALHRPLSKALPVHPLYPVDNTNCTEIQPVNFYMVRWQREYYVNHESYFPLRCVDYSADRDYEHYLQANLMSVIGITYFLGFPLIF